MDDIRLDAGFFDHPKTKRLMRRLGLEGVVALIKLWIYASRYFPKGILTGLTAADVAEGAEWPGGPEAFISALVDAGGPGKAGFLDAVDGTFVLHNWKVRNRFAYFRPERSAQAQRANDARWFKRRKEKQEVNPDRTPERIPDRTPDKNPPLPPPPPPHLREERSKEYPAAETAAGSPPADQTGKGNGSDPTSPKSRTRRKKQYPPEVLRIWEFYCQTVARVPAKKADALRNIAARLKEGLTENQLGDAIARYATECSEKAIPEDHRYHANNFFGSLKQYFLGYMTEPIREGEEARVDG